MQRQQLPLPPRGGLLLIGTKLRVKDEEQVEEGRQTQVLSRNHDESTRI